MTQRPSSLTATAPRFLQVRHLGELLALLADGDRADGMKARRRPARAPCATSISVTARVSFTGRVFGITHTSVNPPAAAAREAARDVLLVLLAGLAEVGVEVDEARGAGARRAPRRCGRGRSTARACDDVVGGVRPRSCDELVLDDDVDLGVELACRVDGTNAAKDEHVLHRPRELARGHERRKRACASGGAELLRRWATTRRS